METLATDDSSFKQNDSYVWFQISHSRDRKEAKFDTHFNLKILGPDTEKTIGPSTGMQLFLKSS